MNTIVVQLMNGYWIACSKSLPALLFPDSKLMKDFFPEFKAIKHKRDFGITDRKFKKYREEGFVQGHCKPRHKVLPPSKRKENEKLIEIRKPIEDDFGLLKNRFQILSSHTDTKRDFSMIFLNAV